MRIRGCEAVKGRCGGDERCVLDGLIGGWIEDEKVVEIVT